MCGCLRTLLAYGISHRERTSKLIELIIHSALFIWSVFGKGAFRVGIVPYYVIINTITDSTVQYQHHSFLGSPDLSSRYCSAVVSYFAKCSLASSSSSEIVSRPVGARDRLTRFLPQNY